MVRYSLCSVYMYGCECGVHMCACVYVCVHESMCACVCVCASVYVCGGDIFCWRGTKSASVLCPQGT